MADAIFHRGPDDGGSWSDPEAGIALGHRRLSIIDLSVAGHQPMFSPSGRYVLVYNGEIYNHLAIRAELDAGERIEWRGHSDTETLVVAIERWGLAAALQRAVGMFALGLWDRLTQTLSLARDRIGEKPLYYGWSSGGGIVFGSELKALRAAPGFANPISEDALALYLRFNYVPAPHAILTGIFKVEPGVIVVLDQRALTASPVIPPSASGTDRVAGVACTRYWSLDDVVARGADDAMTAEEAVDCTERVLSDAITLQNVADVPVGAFLSGGVDSSTIVALLSRTARGRVRTFTIGFAEAGFDEAPFARAVAAHLGTDHTEAYVTPDDVRALIPELPRIYDEPFADSSQLPTVLLSRLARSRVTVALSGDAGDELFGGYNRYRVSGRLASLSRVLPTSVRRGVGNAIVAVAPGRWDQLARLSFLRTTSMAGMKAHKLGRLLRAGGDARAMYRSAAEQWSGAIPLAPVDALAAVDATRPSRGTAAEQMMQWDMMSYLPDDILTKVDRAAMSASLETRVPFLDHRVVEEAWRIPLRFKLRENTGKWVIRRVLDRYVPPALIERPKAGFAIPIGQWLCGPLRDWAEDLLSERALAQFPSLDAAAIRRLWDQHCAGSHDWTGALWGILMFQAWRAMWEGSATPHLLSADTAAAA